MSGRFAPIGPPALLQSIKDVFGEGTLGRYHLTLAHDIVENREAWKGLLPDNSIVIIDNSIIELGKPVDKETMADAWEVLGDYHNYQKVIVLPDTFDETYKTCQDSINYRTELTKVLGDEFECMLVMQVRLLSDVDRFLQLLQLYMQRGLIQWIAIPRRVCDNLGTRSEALYKCLAFQLRWPKLKIHLMGFSNNIQDDMFCAQMQGVEGIDSAVPLRLGQKGQPIDLRYEGDQAGPRGSFWEETKVTTVTFQNLSHVRRELFNSRTSTYRPVLKWGVAP